MKPYVHYVITFLSVLGFTAAALTLHAQAGVFNPSDPGVNYDSTHPPAKPTNGQVGKWVRTPRLTWSTTSFKCYIYNYNNNYIPFRLKYPKNYDSTKAYPILIFFNGDGEAGPTIYDNEYQLYHGAQTHMNAVDKGTFDGFLLYPQNTSAFWSTSSYLNLLL